MFQKKPKKQEKPAASTAPELDVKQVLRDAIDRNSSIGIVRLGQSGQDPFAMGRLLEWNDGGLVLEELQIIGREIRFHVGGRVEAFVKYRDTTLLFEAEIKALEKPTHLNERCVVRSLHLSNPQLLRQGDRRSAFRSSITASGEETPVRMWFLDRKLEEGAEPSAPKEQTNTYYTDLLCARRRESPIPVDEEGKEVTKICWDEVMRGVMEEKPHAVGRLVDITANGLGLLMYGVVKMQLDRFERIVLSFVIDDAEVDLVVENRQALDLRGSTCRVGCLIIHPCIGNVHAPQRRVLERVAMRVQREQLRTRRAA